MNVARTPAVATRLAFAVLVAALLVSGGVVAHEAGLFERGDYERTTLTVVDDETGETLAVVDVRVADTYEKRYTGLSNTESLDEDEGMWFVHDEEGEHAYVMRNMDFPIDIIFVDADGVITEIHSAPVEEDQSDLTRYAGVGKYVLEVRMGYANDNGIEVGDRVYVGDEAPADGAEGAKGTDAENGTASESNESTGAATTDDAAGGACGRVTA